MTLTSKTRPVVRRRAPHFKSKFITTELARLFSQSDSEEEEFQGFSDEEEQRSSRGLKDEEEEEQRSRGVSKRLKNMKVESEEEEDSDVDIGFYSDGEEDASPPRRSLCVAMRFPTKRLSTPTTQEVPQKRAKRAAAARAPPPPPSRRSSRTTPSPPSRRSSRTTPSPPSRRSSRTTPSPSSRSSRTTPSPPCRRSTRRLPKQEEEEQETTTEEVLEKEHRPQRVLLSQILKKEQRPPQRELLLSQILKKEQRPPQRELLLSQILKKQEKKPQRELLLSQSLKKQQERPEQVDLLPQSLKKRNENILENKAMLAKLFSELSTMAELTPLNSPQKKKQTTDKSTARKRRFEAEAGSERRNPSRKARPPENFGVEERSESPSRGGGGRGGPRTVDIRRLLEVDEEGVDASGRKKRRSCVRSGHARSSRYVVRSVDDITRDDLNNIAHRAKDKIWDKENGSSCHQCRQKTLDTKTVCRSGFCSGGKGQFCGPCLKNRYGEDVGTVLLDPEWSCPICRNVCNCSLCRKKEGRCATGILVGLARYNGHDNVHEYLERIQKELS